MNFSYFINFVSKNSQRVGEIDFELDIDWIEDTCFCDSDNFGIGFILHRKYWGIVENRSCFGKDNIVKSRIVDFGESHR